MNKSKINATHGSRMEPVSRFLSDSQKKALQPFFAELKKMEADKSITNLEIHQFVDSAKAAICLMYQYVRGYGPRTDSPRDKEECDYSTTLLQSYGFLPVVKKDTKTEDVGVKDLPDVSKFAHSLIAENNITDEELKKITGTGKDGSILKSDVEEYLAKK